MAVQSGLEVVLEQPPRWLQGARVGLLTTGAAVTGDLVPGAVALKAAGIPLACLLAPEHGVWGDRPAGQPIPDEPDPVTGLPVRSLYRHGEAGPEVLDGLDAVLVDLPDVGVRYYTYGGTLCRLLRLAHRRSVVVSVLDRPNPLGGRWVEGPGVLPGYRSLVGASNVPVRHGLTLAELGRVCLQEEHLDVDYRPIPCRGWARHQEWADLGGVFVPPSPNMNVPDALYLYPGTCLLEGTNVSEGRGTPLPFQVCGAPWMDGLRVSREWNRRTPFPVTARPVTFTPLAGKYAGELCRGVQLHVRSSRSLPAFAAGVHLLALLRDLFPEHVQWRSPAQPSRPFLDLLAGGPHLRQELEAGTPAEEILARMYRSQPPVQVEESLLLYPGARQSLREVPSSPSPC